MSRERTIIILLCISSYALCLENLQPLEEENDINAKLARSFSQVSKNMFEEMDAIDVKYAPIRKRTDHMDESHQGEKIIETILDTNGISDRMMTKFNGIRSMIPTGLNLGGLAMFIHHNSMLFFHRMKLQENTIFSVNSLNNDVSNMVVHLDLSLNDLTLIGTYDRTMLGKKNISELFYTPTLGEVEIEIKNVRYVSEAKYRLLKDRLHVVLVVSDFDCDSITLHFNKTGSGPNLILKKETIETFLDRLKTDLNEWLKDYLNDYFNKNLIKKTADLTKFRQYDAERIVTLNRNVDKTLRLIKNGVLRKTNDTVILPEFKLMTSAGAELQLTDGFLTGVSSVYRRSLAVDRIENGARFVDFNVGFSDMKVIYKYIAVTNTGLPEINGIMIFSADDLQAHMRIVMLRDAETIDTEFDNFIQIKPDALVLEGPLIRVKGNFRHIIEHHTVAIMKNIVQEVIKSTVLPKNMNTLLPQNNRIVKQSVRFLMNYKK